MEFKKNVVYYYDDMIGTFNYSVGHPMKPLRVAMTDELIRKYELYPKMDVIVCEYWDAGSLRGNALR
jgi:histone deacetylase 1/2